MKCWLDKQSVKDIIDSPDIIKFLTNGTTQNLQDTALEEIANKYLEHFNASEYSSNIKAEVDKIKEEKIEDEAGLRERIKQINILFEKAYFIKDNSVLYFFRGETIQRTLRRQRTIK